MGGSLRPSDLRDTLRGCGRAGGGGAGGGGRSVRCLCSQEATIVARVNEALVNQTRERYSDATAPSDIVVYGLKKVVQLSLAIFSYL